MRETAYTANLIECSILLTLNSVTPQNTPTFLGRVRMPLWCSGTVSVDTNHKAVFSTVQFLGTTERCIIVLKPVIYMNNEDCLRGCDSVCIRRARPTFQRKLLPLLYMVEDILP